MQTRVSIIGGGVAGLSCAWYLRRAAERGNRPIEITVFEAAARPGGKIITEKVDGFVIDGGPDSFLTQKPGALELSRELGLEDELIPSNPEQRAVFIFRNGKLHPYPDGFRLAFPTRLGPLLASPLLSVPGRMRMALEPVIPRRRAGGDESMASFIARRVGREALQILAGPLMAGIFTGDPERLGMASTFPQLQRMEAEYGSLYRGFRAARRDALQPHAAEQKGNLGMFASFRGGMGTLIDTLAGQLGKVVQCNTAVRKLERLKAGYRVYTDHTNSYCDALVLATPAWTAAELLEDLQPVVSGQLRSIRHVSTATVSFAFTEPLDLPGYGFLVPKSEGRFVVAGGWSSTKYAPHRAPEGHSLIRAFVGGDGREADAELPDGELVDRVRSDLAGIMQLEAEPAHTRIFRYPKASPQYDLGHLDRVARIEEALQACPGLHLLGNALHGVGIPDTVARSNVIAERVTEIAQGTRGTEGT